MSVSLVDCAGLPLIRSQVNKFFHDIFHVIVLLTLTDCYGQKEGPRSPSLLHRIDLTIVSDDAIEAPEGASRIIKSLEAIGVAIVAKADAMADSDHVER